jgi:broad specificity phosphatase PhoE
MKIIEYRRHSIRNPFGKHLIQKGVDLARKTGNSMSSFNYVITSTKERAFETAIAMGYAVKETLEELSEFNNAVALEIEYEKLTFSKIKKLLEQPSHTLQFAKNHYNLLISLSDRISEWESLLIVSHGGVIDIPLVYMFSNENHMTWEPLFRYCEGFRVTIEDYKIISYTLLRVY